MGDITVKNNQSLQDVTFTKMPDAGGCKENNKKSKECGAYAENVQKWWTENISALSQNVEGNIASVETCQTPQNIKDVRPWKEDAVSGLQHGLWTCKRALVEKGLSSEKFAAVSLEEIPQLPVFVKDEEYGWITQAKIVLGRWKARNKAHVKEYNLQSFIDEVLNFEGKDVKEFRNAYDKLQETVRITKIVIDAETTKERVKDLEASDKVNLGTEPVPSWDGKKSSINNWTAFTNWVSEQAARERKSDEAFLGDLGIDLNQFIAAGLVFEGLSPAQAKEKYNELAKPAKQYVLSKSKAGPIYKELDEMLNGESEKIPKANSREFMTVVEKGLISIVQVHIEGFDGAEFVEDYAGWVLNVRMPSSNKWNDDNYSDRYKALTLLYNVLRTKILTSGDGNVKDLDEYYKLVPSSQSMFLADIRKAMVTWCDNNKCEKK